jgi:Protein of unknown function (DUF2630)/DNA glycosylase AlkZ-like
VSPDRLDLRALNRATLARQLLLDRAPLTALDAVGHLAGLQAQAPLAPYVGLWTRLAGFRHQHLKDLITERAVLRAHLMRNTVHLVDAADFVRFRPLYQPLMERALAGNFGRNLVGVDLAELAATAAVLLGETPLTRAELGARLAPRWPDHDPAVASGLENQPGHPADPAVHPAERRGPGRHRGRGGAASRLRRLRDRRPRCTFCPGSFGLNNRPRAASGRPGTYGRGMDDKEIMAHIDELIETEHQLRRQLAAGELSSQQERERLRSAEEALDQCWDLLRQRRARREFGENPDDAIVRPAGEVEGYQQ